MADYAEWRAQPLGMFLEFDDIEPQIARDICRQALEKRGSGWLATEESRQLLMAMGLPVAPGGVAQTADAAVELAHQVGFPVAVKLASHLIVHKTEMGGIILNLGDEAAVRRAFETIRQRLVEQGNLRPWKACSSNPWSREVWR